MLESAQKALQRSELLHLMLRLTFKLVAIAALSGVLVAQTAPPAARGTARTQNRKAKPKATRTQTRTDPPPVQPPPPQTPEQLPAAAPQVSYQNGLLSIASQNSTIGDILNALKRTMGTSIDSPSSNLAERVAVKLGPGQPKDVLASLFNGSRFDYIILGSAQRPGAIDRVILTQRQSGPSASASQSVSAQNSGAQPHIRSGQAANSDAADVEVDEGNESEQDNAPEREMGEDNSSEEPPPDNQPQQQPGTPQPGETPAVPQVVNPGASQNPGMQSTPPTAEQPTPQPGEPNPTPANPNQPQVKSPEQLLRELQMLQRQQQQQQQQQQRQQPNQPQQDQSEPPQ
ncbi:MAG TPA: hypothetical protein VN622_03115 [Clostridia bacterium]|nr:hypothetical protein [Clostridia bacterium]